MSDLFPEPTDGIPISKEFRKTPVHLPSVLPAGRSWRNTVDEFISASKALMFGIGIAQGETVKVRPTPIPDAVVTLLADMRASHPSLITWSAKIEVCVTAIDDEHRELVRLHNQIIGCSKAADKTEMGSLLTQLGNATALHFANEEQTMRLPNYEHATEHIQEHRALLCEFGHQIEDWQRGLISAELLCRFMHRWLLQHIVVFDQPLGEAIRADRGMLSHEADTPSSAFTSTLGLRCSPQ